MQDNDRIQGPLATVFADLRQGISLPLAILEALINKLTGQSNLFLSVSHALSYAKKVPGIDDLVELLTGIEDGDENDLGTWALNIRKFFGNIDFSDPDFDVDEAFQEFVTTVVQPLIKIRDRLRGLIDISWLTNQHQNLVDESGYDSPITVVSPDDPKITHDATDGVPGSTPLGCLRIECDGANHERAGDMIEVAPGWALVAESPVKWQGLTATAAAKAIRLELQPFHVVDDIATPVGARVIVGSVDSPSGSSGGAGGWGTTITGNYTVPTDGSVNRVVLFPRVTPAASAGVVKFDNTTLVASQDIPQEFVKDLLADLESLLNYVRTWVESALSALGITPSGVLLDDIFDLSDELEWLKQQGEDALAGLAEKLGLDDWLAHLNTLATNPGSLLGQLAMDKISDLEDAFEDIGKIFDIDLSWIPRLPFAEKMQELINRFFGGGPKQVVTQEQVSVASGVPPTDANNTIPWVYLPPELTPAAIGHPWVELTKSGAQTINSGAITKLTGWSQAGGFPLTAVSDVFQVPFSGLFHITVRASWAVSPDTQASVYLYKNTGIYRQDKRITDGMSNVAYNEVSEFVPLDVGDTFDFRVNWFGTGSTRDIASANTYVRITYIGATHLTATPIPTPTVTFDAKGAADNGSGDGGPWNHTFGANAKAIVIPFSHESSDMPTVSCGPYNVPVLSGPTYIGNYFGFDAYYSLAAAILPDAVKGTTQPVTVDFPSGNAAFSGNSLSFNNVAYLGAVRNSSGKGGSADPPRISVASNAFSQVAGGFGGMDANFSLFNRTQDNIWNFSAGNTWAHVMGHSQGGLQFTASGGKWAGKFIELHP
ncbi:hypothetical protein [Mycolicibacterium porcinum]|uniref:hypothetical protein n=1 Tax=Mycolicibacterium porcinum TaxID=39693 RepID=UPI001041E9E2|nr:hypothetical protein [Mycolicibacterium porcinum]